jgi:hypothetical protein
MKMNKKLDRGLRIADTAASDTLFVPAFASDAYFCYPLVTIR